MQTCIVVREGDLIELAITGQDDSVYQVTKVHPVISFGPLKLELEPYVPEVHVDWTMTPGEWNELRKVLSNAARWPESYPYMARLKESGKLDD